MNPSAVSFGWVVLTALRVDLARATILLVGDSTIRALGNTAWATVKAKTEFGNEKVVFVGTAGVLLGHGCSSAPSSCSPAKVLSGYGLGSSSARAACRGVVLNFAGLHLLHMFPHRPWWWDDPTLSKEANTAQRQEAFNRTLANCSAASQLCAFADYEGFVNLERWVERDVSAYRAALPNARIVVATPNWVCDSRYYGYYSRLTTSAVGVAESAES